MTITAQAFNWHYQLLSCYPHWSHAAVRVRPLRLNDEQALELVKEIHAMTYSPFLQLAYRVAIEAKTPWAVIGSNSTLIGHPIVRYTA